MCDQNHSVQPLPQPGPPTVPPLAYENDPFERFRFEVTPQGVKLNGRDVPVAELQLNMVGPGVGTASVILELFDPSFENTNVRLEQAPVFIVKTGAGGVQRRFRVVEILDESNVAIDGDGGSVGGVPAGEPQPVVPPAAEGGTVG